MPLDDIKRLEAEGRWAEICALITRLPGDLAGDDLARAYLSTSKALELTASTPVQYRLALTHAQLSVASALPGGLLHAWALARVAAYSADMGMYPQAEAASLGFCKLLEANPGAAPMEPYALFALGRALSRRGCHGEAIAILRRVVLMVPKGELRERATVTLARALGRAGRTGEALSTLPESVSHVPNDMLHSAFALISARAHRWADAEAEGREALRSIGTRPLCDLVEAAELLLTLKQAAHSLGRHRQAAVWQVYMAALLSRWSAEALLSLLSTLRVEGGAELNEAVSRCGSSGDHRCGLRGAVG